MRDVPRTVWTSLPFPPPMQIASGLQAARRICVSFAHRSPFQSRSACGWQAHLTDNDEAAFYCAKCAEREFGDA
jgi:hypothetical protein